MFLLPHKPLNISIIGTCNHCEFLHIAEKTYPWILLPVTSIHKLEGRNIWLHPCHRWPAYRDGILQASQGHNCCFRPCRSHYRCCSVAPWLAWLKCHQLRLSVHLEVLVIVMLLLRQQMKTLFHFLFSNGWADRKAKQHYRSLSLGLCQLWIE